MNKEYIRMGNDINWRSIKLIKQEDNLNHYSLGCRKTRFGEKTINLITKNSLANIDKLIRGRVNFYIHESEINNDTWNITNDGKNSKVNFFIGLKYSDEVKENTSNTILESISPIISSNISTNNDDYKNLMSEKEIENVDSKEINSVVESNIALDISTNSNENNETSKEIQLNNQINNVVTKRKKLIPHKRIFKHLGYKKFQMYIYLTSCKLIESENLSENIQVYELRKKNKKILIYTTKKINLKEYQRISFYYPESQIDEENWLIKDDENQIRFLKIKRN